MLKNFLCYRFTNLRYLNLGFISRILEIAFYLEIYKNNILWSALLVFIIIFLPTLGYIFKYGKETSPNYKIQNGYLILITNITKRKANLLWFYILSYCFFIICIIYMLYIQSIFGVIITCAFIIIKIVTDFLCCHLST